MGSIPASSSLLLELAEATLASAKRLNEGLAAEGLQQPSFAADGPVYVVPKTASKETQDAKTAVAEVAFQLFQLVTGPSELLPNITASVCDTHLQQTESNVNICNSTTQFLHFSGSINSTCCLTSHWRAP